ncbi:MAG TPA: phosphoribosylformylglycinamidine synthase subunit PurS [Armatimonadota bacterium]|jgi:phosphoribosylformylglycinamidine (FGAM) synthase PurS component
MHEIELLVTLKIPDVTALTAANTMRRRLGFAERLVDLQRADYYRLEIDAESEQAALDQVTDLAQRTNHFVNPNKHSFAVRVATTRMTPPSRGDAYEVEVLTTDAEGDRSADLELALANDQITSGRIKAVHTGVLWTLWLRAESPQEALGLARELAVTRARDHGLLANPHFQEVRIG